MKWIAVPILIFLMATQAFSKWVLLLEFQWNQAYIAKNLCINKAKPHLKCGGKCQLMKKMAEEEKENAPAQNSSDKSKFAEVLFTSASASFFTCSLQKEANSFFIISPHWKPYSPPCSVFRPPLV